MGLFSGKHILIIVENLPLPFDRRVWQEANTLKEEGAEVSVICPQMKGYTKSYECLNGIHIYRHPLPIEANGAMGYFAEYSIALFWEFVLTWKIYFKNRFQVIQGCNPPDLLFIPALLFRLLGVKYVFDHHDITPELYIAKYNKKGGFHKLMLFFEKLTFKVANYSIATNESYKKIAIERGGMKEDRVFVIRSGPKLDRLRLTQGNVKYKCGRTFLIGYVGVIGEQEGVDFLLASAKYIIERRRDVQFAIVGGGTKLEKLKLLSIEMGIEDYVNFYGRIDDEILVDILNTADVCVNPDKPTEMNNLSTMNKIMEYMALKKPIVQYDLKEGRFSAQESSLYSKYDTNDFAEKIIWLLEHPDERKTMGEFGYKRVINELSWDYESKKLIRFYSKVFSLNHSDVHK
jgi:glycosyltransferase involved in cell wall biosynthesis